ncbi:hypothetical protein B0T17DRAFT_617268 [Bombardia bombarda]|uniref:Uncharacterized protein n=1 Tax=Bombardia bombarda TaxID=252184 RepID=A0AA39X0R6_9PEZI|nr:hypothetical protein B0T17DRAFT_617268 [Bombardia bombarda]
MHSRFIASVLLAPALVLAGCPAKPPCAPDAVINILTNPDVAETASSFCSAFNQATTTTSITATETATVEVTVEAPPSTTTTTEVQTLTEVVTLTSTTFSAVPAKRADVDFGVLSALSRFPSPRISSACSCLVATPSATLTETATVATETAIESSTTIVQPTTVIQVTLSETVTESQTTTFTTVIPTLVPNVCSGKPLNLCCMNAAPWSSNSAVWGGICGYYPSQPSELVGARCISREFDAEDDDLRSMLTWRQDRALVNARRGRLGLAARDLSPANALLERTTQFWRTADLDRNWTFIDSTMSTTPHVEARSLAAINSLAANPPQYPHHPELRESLTLYISRVPGTRDIILSTLKPQRKNVTAEDVANSLYYVHLDLPSDELLAAPRRVEGATSPRTSGESARAPAPIHRKPLPAFARVQSRENNVPDTAASPAAVAPRAGSPVLRQTAPAPAPVVTAAPPPQEATVDGYRPNPVFLGKQPGTTSETNEISTWAQVRPSPPLGAPLARRPLGPRPQGTSAAPERDFPPSIPPSTTGSVAGRPVTPTNHGSRPASHAVEQGQAASPPYSPRSRIASPNFERAQRASFAPFSLSLIRRDPSSGNQWNIGKVSSFQTNIPTPDAADPNLNPDDMGALPQAQKINIHIESSGYAKYRNMPSRANVEAYRPMSAQSIQQSMRGLMSARSPDSAPPGKGGVVVSGHNVIEEGFSRQVMMSYTKSWKSNFKSAFRRHDRRESQSAEDAISPSDLAPPKMAQSHQRHGSSSSVGSMDSAVWGEGGAGKPTSRQPVRETRNRERDQSPSLITQPGPGVRPKGYVFMSPWDGICEFRTSSSGRSLKCRHILDPRSPKFDPAVLAQNVRDAQATGRSRGDSLSSALVGAKSVSELRFNLPSGDVFKSPGGKGPNAHHIQSHFQKLLKIDPRSSDEDEDEDDEDAPMDLSLGQENAGGGNRGKRAKLGKLIIHDEGLKMMDLVVAANVGVWWTTWERTF